MIVLLLSFITILQRFKKSMPADDSLWIDYWMEVFYAALLSPSDQIIKQFSCYWFSILLNVYINLPTGIFQASRDISSVSRLSHRPFGPL